MPKANGLQSTFSVFLLRNDEAIEAYKKALQINPEYDLALFNLGGLYWNVGEHQAAKRTWTKAVEKFPEHDLATKASVLMKCIPG